MICWNEWWEERTDDVVDDEVSASSEAPASISREPLHQESPIKMVSDKQSISTSERPKLRSLHGDQNYKGTLQKTHQ